MLSPVMLSVAPKAWSLQGGSVTKLFLIKIPAANSWAKEKGHKQGLGSLGFGSVEKDKEQESTEAEGKATIGLGV